MAAALRRRVTLVRGEVGIAEQLARTLASTVLPELADDELEIDYLFERELFFENESDRIVETVEVKAGETHLAGFGMFVEEGSVAARVLEVSE